MTRIFMITELLPWPIFFTDPIYAY